MSIGRGLRPWLGAWVFAVLTGTPLATSEAGTESWESASSDEAIVIEVPGITATLPGGIGWSSAALNDSAGRSLTPSHSIVAMVIAWSFEPATTASNQSSYGAGSGSQDLKELINLTLRTDLHLDEMLYLEMVMERVREDYDREPLKLVDFKYENTETGYVLNKKWISDRCTIYESVTHVLSSDTHVLSEGEYLIMNTKGRVCVHAERAMVSFLSFSDRRLSEELLLSSFAAEANEFFRSMNFNDMNRGESGSSATAPPASKPDNR